MKATVGQPVKVQLRNAYEGGLQGPCTAEVVDISVTPTDLGTVKDGLFLGSREGDGKLSAQFIYPDGASNAHEVPLNVIPLAVMEVIKEVQVPVPTQPKLTGGLILDPE